MFLRNLNSKIIELVIIDRFTIVNLVNIDLMTSRFVILYFYRFSRVLEL